MGARSFYLLHTCNAISHILRLVEFLKHMLPSSCVSTDKFHLQKLPPLVRLFTKCKFKLINRPTPLQKFVQKLPPPPPFMCRQHLKDFFWLSPFTSGFVYRQLQLVGFYTSIWNGPTIDNANNCLSA